MLLVETAFPAVIFSDQVGTVGCRYHQAGGGGAWPGCSQRAADSDTCKVYGAKHQNAVTKSMKHVLLYQL